MADKHVMGKYASLGYAFLFVGQPTIKIDNHRLSSRGSCGA
jgi:hypothetical protein